MTKFVKKSKQEEAFDSNKIYKSIINAMKSGSGLLRPKIAQVIKEEAEEKFLKKENVASKEIDKFVIGKLNEYGQEITNKIINSDEFDFVDVEKANIYLNYNIETSK